MAALVLPVGHDLSGYYDGFVAVHQVRRGVEVTPGASESVEFAEWSALAPSPWHTRTTREQSAATSLDALLDDVRELLVNGCAYLDVVP